MINVSESAKQELAKYFEDKEIQPIRVYLADGGCSGPALSLALDDPRDGDKTVEKDDLTFLINEELAEVSGEVSIDMTQYGFTVVSEKELPNQGGSCGSCCGSCSC